MDERFELTETEEQILDRLTERIPYEEIIFGSKNNYFLIMEDLIRQARKIALSRVFPFYDYSKKTLPVKYTEWQYRCAIELYNLADKSGFHTYSENGLSWGKITDGVSKQLLEELMPRAGILQKVEEEREAENE